MSEMDEDELYSTRKMITGKGWGTYHEEIERQEKEREKRIKIIKS